MSREFLSHLKIAPGDLESDALSCIKKYFIDFGSSRIQSLETETTLVVSSRRNLIQE